MTNHQQYVSNLLSGYSPQLANVLMFSIECLAGAEGLEPSTLGFGGVGVSRRPNRLAPSEASNRSPPINGLGGKVSNQSLPVYSRKSV